MYWQVYKVHVGISLSVCIECMCRYCTDRQTNSFIENSIEAGILLGGNGILHAIMVARAVARVTLSADQLLIICDHSRFRSYPLSHYADYSMLTLTWSSLLSLARKVLFSIWVDGVVLLPLHQVLLPRRGSSCLQRVHNASGWSSAVHWSCLVGRWSGLSESSEVMRSQRFRFGGFRLAVLRVSTLEVCTRS